MPRIRKHKISLSFLIILFFVYLCLTIPILGTSPMPSLYLQKHETTSRYSGSLISGSRKWRLEDVRITLYDHNKQLMESAMLFEYSRNSDYGYFLGYRDNNDNSRLDGADTFFVYEKGEVQPSWGIELTYEKTGRIITRSTLSGKYFSIEDKEEPDYKMLIRYYGLILIIVNLLIILGVVYKMPCV